MAAIFIARGDAVLNKRVNMDDRFAEDSAHLLEVYTGVKAVRPMPPKAFREDGSFQNVLTNYGTQKDQSEHYEYATEGPTPDNVLTSFYEENGLFARIIDVPAEEAVKHGFELKNINDDKLKNFLAECLDELDWEETAMQAIKWTRLFGGAIAVMLINDGRNLEDPVDWNHIKSIDDIRLYDRSVVVPDYSSMYVYDERDPFRTRGSRLGYPARFMVSGAYGSFVVHEQRCLIFRNGVLPENTSSGQYRFWGIPEYTRIKSAIKDVEVAHGMAPKMLDRSIQAIYKMRDLANLLQQEDGLQVLLKRLNTIDMSRGLLNSMVLDADGEDYDFKSFSYAGVAEVINTTCNYLSALTNIPQTILFGRSPAGMNATGSSDLENYYNYIERIQKRMLRSNLRYLLSVICQAGVFTREIDKVPHIDVEFNPLWSMTEQEKVALDAQRAQVESTRANTAVAYVGAQILDPSEVRKDLGKEDEFDVETILDDYTDEEIEKNAPAAQGGGDPLAAMMGGGMPQGAAAPQKNGEKAAGAEMPAPKEKGEGSASGNTDEDVVRAFRERRAERLKTRKSKYGDAPDAVPEATRLPEDQDDIIETQNEDEEQVPDENAVVPRGGVGVIVVQGDKILTGTRIDGDAGGYGLMCGPGGHIDGDEEPIEAAIRETQEEFGITPMDLKQLGTIRDEDTSVVKSYVFLSSGYIGVPKCDDVEMRRPVWRTLEEMYSIEDRLFQPFKDSLGLIIERMYRYDEEKKEIEFTSLEDVVNDLYSEKNDA